MSMPIDQDVRTLALDQKASFIVQAPAGSGKTELLTRRVLTLLCHVDEPEEILAITFTRKAAGEMRQRVVEMLQHASTDPVTDDPYELDGISLAKRVLQRDVQRSWQLLRNPQRLNLRTIDALATQLAHRLPVTSTLGAPTGLIENADALYQDAARRFIESNLQSLDLVLLHLGNKLDKAQSLLAGLLSKRDQWKRHVYNAGEDHEVLREILEGMLAELIESRLQHLCSKVPPGLEAGLLPCLLKAAEFALAEAEGDVSELCWEMQLWHKMKALPGDDISDLHVWGSVAHALLTSANELRKQVNKTIGFPAKGDAKKLGKDAAELEMHKQAMVDVLARAKQTPDFLEALVEVRKLPAPVYKDEQWALLSQLLTVLPDLLIELQLVFAENARVDFSEISARAALSLGTDDAPTDLALAMDLKLKHLLVDEFQDTSLTQFRLFQQLVKPWEQGDGRTFFAVGDPMQSIYRFREGDVALFTQVQEHGIGGVNVSALTLTVNFRAAPIVTRWVNRTFSSIFPPQADTDTGAVPYSPSQAHRDYQGSVQVHPLIDADKSAEAATVAQLCIDAITDDPQHSVAILVRSRAQTPEIFKALREHELAYEAIDMDLLGERAVVRDLITLTMALRYPHDRLHWLSLLRAPFVGLCLHDLHALMQEAGRQAAVIERLQDDDVLHTLSADGRQRIERLLHIIEPAMKQSMRSRLVPWVESVWLNLGGPAVCFNDIDLDAANRSIALLYQLEAQGELWSKSVIETAMAGLYAAPANTTACQIQIMTLHKSKGLEFDTVILPALDRRSRADSTQLLNWFESTLDGAPQLLIAPFEATGIDTYQRDRINKLVQRAKERCDDQEKLRLLYVACTRARRHLHLVARSSYNADRKEVRAPIAASLLAPLWPLLKEQFEASAIDDNVSSKDISTNDITPGGKDADSTPRSNKAPQQGQLDLSGNSSEEGVLSSLACANDPIKAAAFQRLPLDAELPQFAPFKWQLNATVEADQDRQALEFQWAGRDARDIGTVVHEQLQMLADAALPSLGDKDVQARQDIIRRQLKNLGINGASLDNAVRKVARALTNTLSDGRGRWILQPHNDARSEWALTVPLETAGYRRASQVIIDRTFVDAEGTRWIVDYKTGDHEGGDAKAFLDREQERYADQLDRYADIVRRMDNRPVKVGLYFPMLKGWREWEPGP